MIDRNYARELNNRATADSAAELSVAGQSMFSDYEHRPIRDSKHLPSLVIDQSHLKCPSSKDCGPKDPYKPDKPEKPDFPDKPNYPGKPEKSDLLDINDKSSYVTESLDETCETETGEDQGSSVDQRVIDKIKNSLDPNEIKEPYEGDTELPPIKDEVIYTYPDNSSNNSG